MIGLVFLGLAGIVGLLAAIGARRWLVNLRPVTLVFGILLLVAGPVLTYTESRTLTVFMSHRSWPTTEGEVVSSRVIGTRAFRPDIVYQYAVNGVVYTDSTTLETPPFGGRNSKYNVAETLAKEYPPGRPVTVHYDPLNPARSGLRVGPTWDVYGKLGLGGLLFGFGVFWVVGYGAGRMKKGN
ncbi:MAG: DUF3592 domain-containing protein [Candidatus Zixiibacteriota bacterium]